MSNNSLRIAMEAEYELSQQLHGHDGNVRSMLVMADGSFITGGSKGDIIAWKSTGQDGKVEMQKKMTHHSGTVFALTESTSSPGCFYSGSQDKTAVRVDEAGNPATHFTGHTGPVCSLAERGSQLITGSWDGTVKVWNSLTGAVESTLQVGKNAVVVAVLPSGEIATGSQDGCLAIWRGTECVNKIASAHTEKINAIFVTNSGMLTASHDSNIKLWSFDCFEMKSWCGHNNFVYHVSLSMGNDMMLSTADDCTLKLWSTEDYSCKQSIVHSASVWQAAGLGNQDIVTVCSDATIRIWTSDLARFAPTEEREAQKEEAVQAMFKPLKNGSSSVPTEQVYSEIMDVAHMGALEGTIHGDVKCFKEGETLVGCQWDKKNHCWQRTAIFVDAGEDAPPEKQWYIGDNYFPFAQYDYVFNVDMSEAGHAVGESRSLPYNTGQNPMEVAETFCTREGIHRSYIEQVRAFIIQNVAGAANIPAGGSVPGATSSTTPAEPTSNLFPVMEICSFKDGKFDALQSKLVELNAQVDEGLRMGETEMSHFNDAIEKLKRGVTADFKAGEKQVVMVKLKEWPQDKIFPVIDLWRLFLVHPASADFFKGSDRGVPYISQVLTLFTAEPSGPLGLCCSRFLANLFIYQTSRYAAFDKRDLILKVLDVPLSSGSKHVKVACTSILLNIANVLHESSTPPKAWDSSSAANVAKLSLDFIGKAGPDDADALKRAVLAIGTLLPRDWKNGRIVAQRCKEAGLPDQIDGMESKIGAPVAAEFKKLLA